MHQKLHAGAFSDAEAEIHRGKRPPAELPLHDQAEGPEEDQVARQMEDARVHEEIRDPRERVQDVAQDQGPLFIAPRWEEEINEDVGGHYPDRGDRPMVDRRISPPWDDHVSLPILPLARGDQVYSEREVGRGMTDHAGGERLGLPEQPRPEQPRDERRQPFRMLQGKEDGCHRRG